jgi:hypothetical protein
MKATSSRPLRCTQILDWRLYQSKQQRSWVIVSAACHLPLLRHLISHSYLRLPCFLHARRFRRLEYHMEGAYGSYCCSRLDSKLWYRANLRFCLHCTETTYHICLRSECHFLSILLDSQASTANRRVSRRSTIPTSSSLSRRPGLTSLFRST